MKNNSHTNPMMMRIMVLITCFVLVMLYNKSKAANMEIAFKKIAPVLKHHVVKHKSKEVIHKH